MLTGSRSSEFPPRPDASGEPSLAEKVAFLLRPDSYQPPAHTVTRHETHMSEVFLADDTVYKLKKPVRFPYLDFSTLKRREAACRAELTLNRRLAPDIYRGVVALTKTPSGLAIGGGGEVVDWLVAMKRLDAEHMLDRTIAGGRLERWQLDRLAATLVAFYRRARAAFISPALYRARLWSNVAYNRRVLLDRRLALPAGVVHQVDAVQRRFLVERGAIVAARVRARCIVDGHGDLRPEHVWLGDPVRIIDCLEFNAAFRIVDPLDELAFLCIECERLGAAWAGDYLQRRVARALHDGHSGELVLFYRCHRATLRARLAIAHLLEAEPHTPAKWPALARTYLRLAYADAVRLERSLKKPIDR